jgi:hypothetical protein
MTEASRGDLTSEEVNAAAAAIEAWLTGVRQVLRAVEELPSTWGFPAGRIEVTDGPQRTTRVVSRPLVRLYVDSHLVRRLKSLDKALAIESFSVQDDDRAERLGTLLTAISGYRSRRLTRRIRDQVTKFIAPYILFVVGPAVILGGIDGEDVRRAFVLVVLLASLPVYFLFVRFLTIPWGFVPKRALWSGAVTVESVDRHGVETTRQWVGFPSTDLYRREAAMFRALRVPVAPEYPLDISVGIDIAFAVMVAGMVVGVGALVWYGAPIGGILVLAVVTAGLAVQCVADVGAHNRMRKARVEGQRIESAVATA